MHDVESSNIAQVGHDGSDLFVKFTTGTTYKYKGVPEAQLMDLMGAPSVGKYFAAHVKTSYPFEKVA
jgi:hypothetical protein